jgi:hypothetical protein
MVNSNRPWVWLLNVGYWKRWRSVIKFMKLFRIALTFLINMLVTANTVVRYTKLSSLLEIIFMVSLFLKLFLIV